MRCKKCGVRQTISPGQRHDIRWFLHLYPWVSQINIARLLGVSQCRISEIVRQDAKRGGK